MPRVVVTGIGVMSAAGIGVPSFANAIQAGRSCIAPLQGWPDNTFRFSQSAQIPNYDPNEYFEEKQLSLIDRTAQLALIAAREAVAQAGDGAIAANAAVVTGCCVGGQNTMDAAFVDLYQRSAPRVNPMSIPRIMANCGASQVSMEFGIGGPAYTVSTACASSSHAIGQAFHMVRSGAVPMAITGGHEAIFSFGFLKGWEAMRVVSPDTCRPFSRDRKGMILGEGAAMMVIEPLERAQARGARILAEICGFGMSADAHHITQPTAEGPARAIRGALTDAGMDAVELGYINAHGTGTVTNDPVETQAIRLALGEAAERVAVSSTKSMHGHTLGAAGAIEAVATILALSKGLLPATVNFTDRDPQCDLDVIPNEPRRVAVPAALSNSFAFGGLNAVLAFRRLDA